MCEFETSVIDLNTHTHTHTHTRTRVGQGYRYSCEKDSLKIVTEQMRLEGGFRRGDRIRVAECSRQIVPNRWVSVRKRSVTKRFLFTRRVTKIHV